MLVDPYEQGKMFSILGNAYSDDSDDSNYDNRTNCQLKQSEIT